MGIKNLFGLWRMQNKNTKKQHRSKKKQHKPKKDEALMKILLPCHDFFIFFGWEHLTPNYSIFLYVESTTGSRGLRAPEGPTSALLSGF